jgi:hypothetical protein
MRKAFLIVLLIAASANLSDLNAQCLKGNCYTGNGLFKFPNGDQYDGQWVNGKPQGQGTYIFLSGDKYFGGFIAGKREGMGRYVWIKGGIYVGNWKLDKRDGYGKYTWLSSAAYMGYWKDDQIIDMNVNTVTDSQAKPVEGN